MPQTTHHLAGPGKITVTNPVKAQSKIPLTGSSSMTVSWTTTNTGRVTLSLMRYLDANTPVVDRSIVSGVPSLADGGGSHVWNFNATQIVSDRIYFVRVTDTVQNLVARTADFSFDSCDHFVSFPFVLFFFPSSFSLICVPVTFSLHSHSAEAR